MTKLAARFARESGESELEKCPRGVLSKCRRVALKLITHHGNAVRNVPLMRGFARGSDVIFPRLAETPEGFLAATRFPSHPPATIVPPMLGLSVIDLREGKVMAVFLPFSLVPAFIIRARTKRDGAGQGGRAIGPLETFVSPKRITIAPKW